MNSIDGPTWQQCLEPADTIARMVMAVLELLLDKDVVSEEDLAALADHTRQELVTEEEARLWHTPLLPTAALAEMAGLTSDMVVLDAGSGFGGPARQLAEDFGCRVIGVDSNPLRVLHALRQTAKMGLGDRVSFCWGDFRSLPFLSGTFDLVWAMESVTRYDRERLPDLPTGMHPDIFQEFHRVLKADGRLACQLWLRGPVGDDDLMEFLRLQSFALADLDDCTETWLACMLDAIDHIEEDDERRASWQKTHDEAIRRGDKAYRFIARPAS